MKSFLCRPLALSTGIAIAIFSGSLAAQNLDQLKDLAGGSGVGGAASSLGSLSSITAGSTGNAAGVIEYCSKNNYLDASSASPIKDQLMGKTTGSGTQPPESNPDYLNGARGIVTGTGGQTLDLSMTGLKAEAITMVCQKILEQGKSLLRGTAQ